MLANDASDLANEYVNATIERRKVILTILRSNGWGALANLIEAGS